MEFVVAESKIVCQVSGSSHVTLSLGFDRWFPPSNEWSATQPQALIQLLEAWSDVLPQFVWDNVLDQLILPKVQKAIMDWNPRRDSTALHSLLFPWLPHVGLRLEQVVGDARRKVKSLFRAWKVEDGVLEDLMAWKNVSRDCLTLVQQLLTIWVQVFDSADWQDLLLKYVVPKLGSTLRDEFKINPRNQNLEPLKHVLPWADHLKPSIFAQLLETEFFPKWLNTLHIWLIQPNASFEEIEKWFKGWKEVLGEKVVGMPAVQHGFTAGLQLIYDATGLGVDAPRLLKKPEFKPLSSSLTPASTSTAKSTKSSAAEEVTFRSVVEEYAGQHNLLFIPSGKTHEKSRLPLYKVSPSVDGRGGLMVYVQDEAVWAARESGGEEWRAIGLEEMVIRASKGKK